jgi:Cu2+-containing amine oxidase
MAPYMSDIVSKLEGLVTGPTSSSKHSIPHPLDNLSVDEINKACAIAKSQRPGQPLWIKICTLKEPVSLCVFLHHIMAHHAAKSRIGPFPRGRTKW